SEALGNSENAPRSASGSEHSEGGLTTATAAIQGNGHVGDSARSDQAAEHANSAPGAQHSGNESHGSEHGSGGDGSPVPDFVGSLVPSPAADAVQGADGRSTDRASEDASDGHGRND